MKIDTIINSLKNMGFTEYEARIYIALLKNHPANGNAISVASGVPGPKIYETLRKMLDKDLVFLVSVGDKSGAKRYSPIPYQDLLATMETTFLENVATLNESLEKVSKSGDNDWTELFVIEGYEPAIEAVNNTINEAENEVIVSCWTKELNLLFTQLNKAHQRGVRVNSIVFDNCFLEIPWRNFKHYFSPLASKRHNGELSVVVDFSKAIVLESLHQQPHAVVSSHRAMIQTTRNYIRHDIYVNRLIHDFQEVIKERYGNGLEKLIDDF